MADPKKLTDLYKDMAENVSIPHCCADEDPVRSIDGRINGLCTY
jgi:hypothetical protein